jgi:sporulation protein YlmC with PRC-barrel domain
MDQLQTFNEKHKTSAPAILELLSELEKRDMDSRGEIQAAFLTDSTLKDPRNKAVINPAGNDVGKVDDLYVDPNTRIPHFALLALGRNPLGIGDRRVLVAYDDLTVDSEDRVLVKVAIP